MTAEQVRALRERLGLDRADWCRLLAVNESTVIRWERGSGSLAIDPRNRALLDLLTQMLAKRNDVQARNLGTFLEAQIRARGGLYGLYRLLGIAYVGAPDFLERAVP